MIDSRVNKQPVTNLIKDVSDLDDAIRELKTAPQFTEAKLYDYSSTNAYDITGSLTVVGGTSTTATVVVTVTSVDSSSFIATVTPQLWMNTLTSQYHDNIISDFQVVSNQIITDDPTKMQFWITISTRRSTSGLVFYFKANVYSTAPVTLSYARTV